MTATSEWLGSVGISNINVADESNRHDGFVELHTEVALSRVGESRLEEFLVPKIKGIEEIFVSGTTIKVIAKKKPDGTAPTSAELKKLANSAIKAMQTWASQQDEGDLTFIISSHSRERELEAMATNSTKQPYGAGENSSSTY